MNGGGEALVLDQDAGRQPGEFVHAVQYLLDPIVRLRRPEDLAFAVSPLEPMKSGRGQLERLEQSVEVA